VIYSGIRQPRGTRRAFAVATIVSVSLLGLTAGCKASTDAPLAVPSFVTQSPSPSSWPSPIAAPTTAAAPATTAAAVPATAAAPKKTTSKPKPAPTTKKPTPKPTTKKPTQGPPRHSGAITPGAFCKVAEEGWIGFSAAGKQYVCRDVDHDGHPHWAVP
jgi:hypothetical protein